MLYEDVGRRDLFISLPAAISEDTPVGWWEGYKANVAYNNMPLIEHVEEKFRFADQEFDPDFDVVAQIPDELLPYYDDLVKAKNAEHYEFLQERAFTAIERRRVAAEAGITAQLAGGITDPLALVSLIPGLQFIKAGQTFGQAVIRGAGAGLTFGLASEARRAPFAVADEPYEAASNIVMSTALSAGFGGLMRAAPYVKPFFQSGAAKLGRIYRGEKIKHIWTDDAANIDDGYKAAPEGVGDFDIDQMSWINNPNHKRLGDKEFPDEAKSYIVDLAYNASLPLSGAKKGLGRQSVAQDAATYIGMFHGVDESLRNLHSQQVRGIAKAARVGGIYDPTSGFNNWANDTLRRYILSNSNDPRLQRLGKEGITDQQKEAGVILADLFKGFSDEINFSGLSKNNDKLRKTIKLNQDKLDKTTKKLADLEDSIKRGGGATKKQAEFRDYLDGRQAELRAAIEMYEGQIDSPLRSNFVFPIFYDKDKLMQPEARAALTNIFAEDYKMQRLANGEDPAGAFADAERTLSRIMQEDAEDMENILRSADVSGRAKHLRQRKTNIDVAKVVDYILPTMDSLYTYIDRMGRQISFANKFGGRNIDEVLSDYEDVLRNAGKSNKEIIRAKADLYADYERVMGTLQRSADRWDWQAAKAAKAWAGWTFLPFAGVSALTDPGSIVMAHGMREVFRAAAAATDTAFTGKVIREAQLAGELLEMTKNVHARELLSDTVRRVKPNLNERVIQRGNQIMYTANGLAPITFAGKTLDQIITNNKFIKLSRKWADGKISLFDREYLARYGIDEDMAKFIAKAPTEKHDRFDFEFANTDAWPQSTGAEREILRRYRAALNSHANNTIVMGQTFDKPIIVDGVAYIRDNPFFQAVRKKFPSQFPIEKRLRTGNENMVRIESGLMTLPFTFMNFAFGANNKILGAVRDPNRRYRLQGVAALIGLSYMSLAIKKPDYWFEKRELPEILARIIDHSGVLGIYSDLAYTGLNIAGNLGLDTPIPPKYVSPNKDERMMDAFIEPFGAPAGLGLEYGRALRDFMNGDVSDGAERLKYTLPFIGLYPIRDDMRELIGSVGRN